MSSDLQGFLDVARKDLGYREKSSGYTKFGDWYFANIDKQDTYFKKAPWCDMFITWAATEAGVQEYVGQFASTVQHARWFERQGAWSQTPEPGALVFYDWGGSKSIGAIDHVGIVEKVVGDKIVTIEGNVDRIWLRRKERDQHKVVGYGLPRKVREFKLSSLLAAKSAGVGAGSLAAPQLTDLDAGALEFAEGFGAAALVIALCTVLTIRYRRRRAAAAVAATRALSEPPHESRHRRPRVPVDR
ncbi:CHAP domain-containing protein [Streptosporangiaceae bacterium NEAU-GS5]|nr:CHAP domain-containing protein [Streptosporangiaceae bacterium NEAU-GS5]